MRAIVMSVQTVPVSGPMSATVRLTFYVPSSVAALDFHTHLWSVIGKTVTGPMIGHLPLGGEEFSVYCWDAVQHSGILLLLAQYVAANPGQFGIQACED